MEANGSLLRLQIKAERVASHERGMAKTDKREKEQINTPKENKGLVKKQKMMMPLKAKCQTLSCILGN